MSQLSEDDIYYYVEDLLLNHNSVFGEKVKTVRIHKIKPIGPNKFDVEFSVETYRSLSDFVPDKGRWISQHMKIDANDLKIQRDIKLNHILKNPDK